MIEEARSDDPNVAMLEIATQMLDELCNSLVFVGGCATGLLVTAARAQKIRATKDVDLIAKAMTIGDYHAIEEQLSARGFKHDISPEAPICRWVGSGVILDLMPSEPGVIGFHNRWYPLAVETARPARLPSGRLIRLIAAPIFIATKLEAFLGRGKNDFMASHDLEDIVTVVDGRASLIDEARLHPEALKNYLIEKISSLMAAPAWIDALPGHLPGDNASQARLPELIRRFKALTILN